MTSTMLIDSSYPASCDAEENNVWSIISAPPYACSSLFWVREQTIPTEWPLFVAEVSANFCEKRGVV
jgi:hypothetical protein